MVGRCLFALVLCSLLSACSRAASPLARLERDWPVQSQEVLVQQVDVNQRAHVRLSEVHDVSRGDPINVAGTLLPGTWGLSGITAMWKPRADEPASPMTQTKQATDRTLRLMLFLHGDDVTTNLGIIRTEMVEARPSSNPGGAVEFRACIPAPKRSGSYVVDLQLMDQAESHPRGTTRTKPAGFPIWRCQINVK